MAGCPYGPRFPGWSILIEAYYTAEPGRTYGQLNYGSQVYGDAGNIVPAWHDVTRPSFAATVTMGSGDGAPSVNVSQLDLELRDDTGDWWDFAAPARYNLPYVGAPIRVGLIDPAAVYHPIFTGRVAQIFDEHDKPPRLVNVTAHGPIADTVTPILGWQRPVESSVNRIVALATAAGYVPVLFGRGWPETLLADTAPRTIDVRAELDRSAVSNSWVMSETRDGKLWFREWPLAPTGSALWVTDCLEAGQPEGTILAGKIDLAADWPSALLNIAGVANTATHSHTATDPTSISKYGRRGNAFGFPRTGLAYANDRAGVDLATRAVNRWSNIINRVDAVHIDSRSAPTWLAALADLDTGRAVHVDRRGVRPYQLDAVLSGYQHRLSYDRAESTLHLSTITPTL